ncbi:MAG: GTP cyclohydrolase II [Pseudomonadota bacterium]
MFTYLDPTVRERLIAEGHLRRLLPDGQETSPDAPVAAGETVVNLMGPIPLPLGRGGEQTRAATVNWYASVRSTELSKVEELAAELREHGGQQLFSTLVSSMAVNSVMVVGDQDTWQSPLVRIHSSCLTGDVFGSRRCECGPQLEGALDRIVADDDGGMLIYMAGHEGRGIGLWAKAATYLLQDSGEDTYGANRMLGLPDDSRDYSDAATLLHYFVGDRPFRLLTNNPKKIADLKSRGLTRVTAVKHVFGVDPWNQRYLAAKQQWGHRLDDEDITGDPED